MEPAGDSVDRTIQGDRVRLRPLQESDLGRIAEILSEPAVKVWWGEQSSATLREDFLSENPVTLAIDANGVTIGLIQYYEEREPDYRHASIDIALSTAHQGKGLGPDALRTLAGYLYETLGHHRLTIDPATANHRAIRSYRKVGFKPVGVMRQYERGADGTWHDGLLMEMLAEEFEK